MHFKKLPLAIALGAAAVAPLAHAQSSVTVYGKLYPYIEEESGSSPSPVGTPVSTLASPATGVKGVPTIKGMSAGNSRIGFRGTEDMGGGLKAIFQLESVVSVDNGTAGSSTAFWNRDTFVGLVNEKFGTVRLGLMDTVFKEYGDTLGILGISSGTPLSSSNVLRKVGFGTNSASRFHERRANSIRYDSPKFGGFEAGLQVATQENLSATPSAGAAKTYSMGVKWEGGPFYAALAYEQHDNWFGGSFNTATSSMRNTGAANNGVTSKDKAVQATVEWRFAKGQAIEFDVIRKSYDEGAVVNGRFKNYDNTAWLIGYDGRFGLFRVAAHYVKSGAGSCERLNAACTTTGLEGSQITAGVSYSLSKRTYVFGAVSQVNNGAAARFAATDFGTASPGEDSRHLMAGISHSF
ncbi:MAG: porin [Burkholderiaceae bacterium]